MRHDMTLVEKTFKEMLQEKDDFFQQQIQTEDFNRSRCPGQFDMEARRIAFRFSGVWKKRPGSDWIQILPSYASGLPVLKDFKIMDTIVGKKLHPPVESSLFQLFLAR